MAQNEISIAGRRYGSLTALSRGPDLYGNCPAWHCQCDCGASKLVSRSNLTSGSTKSCGCKKLAMTTAAVTKHGGTRRRGKKTYTPEYQAWASMKARCTSPTNEAWKWYGARGIKVCDSWLESFENFLRDMGRRPSLAHSLDRKDSNGNYEPNNCRWATIAQQHSNRTDNVIIEAFGKKFHLAEWARQTGIHQAVIGRRLKKGWHPERAISQPLQTRRLECSGL